MEKKIQKPDRREYTLKIIPHQGGSVHNFRIPINVVKCGVVGLCVVCTLMAGVVGYSFYNIRVSKLNQNELDELRSVNVVQKQQIVDLAKKTGDLQEEMSQLTLLEKEIRKIAAMDGDVSRSGGGRAYNGNGGQGGPIIPANPDNINQSLDNLKQIAAARRQSMEILKNDIEYKNAQLAVTPSIWPTSGEVSSRFGLRWGGSEFHPGIDIANDIGTPIYATADGVVIESGWNSGGYGYLVDINHGNGVVTRYAHNDSLVVQAGTYVKKGQLIAYMGNTGFSTGPHVHYEVIVNGKTVDPSNFL